MLKVLCINTSNLTFLPLATFQIVENEVYEVLEECSHLGYHFYLLHTDCNFAYWYCSKRFVPLSEVDELELQAERDYTWCV